MNEAQRINNLNKKMAIRLENVKSVYIKKDCGYHIAVKSRKIIIANYVRFPFLISRNSNRTNVSHDPSKIGTPSLSTRDKNAPESQSIHMLQNRIGRENICLKSKRNRDLRSLSGRGGKTVDNELQPIGRRKPTIKYRNKPEIVGAAPSSSSLDLEGDKSVTDNFNCFDEHTEFAQSNEDDNSESVIDSLITTDMVEDNDNYSHSDRVNVLTGGKSSKTNLADDDKSNSANWNICEGEVYDSDFEIDINDVVVSSDDALFDRRENLSQEKESSIRNEADTMRSEIELIKRTWRRQLAVDTGCDSPFVTIPQKQEVR